MHQDAPEAQRPESGEEIAPALRGLGKALGCTYRIPVFAVVQPDGDHHGDVPVGAFPAAF